MTVVIFAIAFGLIWLIRRRGGLKTNAADKGDTKASDAEKGKKKGKDGQVEDGDSEEDSGSEESSDEDSEGEDGDEKKKSTAQQAGNSDTSDTEAGQVERGGERKLSDPPPYHGGQQDKTSPPRRPSQPRVGAAGATTLNKSNNAGDKAGSKPAPNAKAAKATSASEEEETDDSETETGTDSDESDTSDDDDDGVTDTDDDRNDRNSSAKPTQPETRRPNERSTSSHVSPKDLTPSRDLRPANPDQLPKRAQTDTAAKSSGGTPTVRQATSPAALATGAKSRRESMVGNAHPIPQRETRPALPSQKSSTTVPLNLRSRQSVLQPRPIPSQSLPQSQLPARSAMSTAQARSATDLHAVKQPLHASGAPIPRSAPSSSQAARAQTGPASGSRPPPQRRTGIQPIEGGEGSGQGRRPSAAAGGMI